MTCDRPLPPMPPYPPGGPWGPRTRHAGPGPALAGVMAIGATVVILALVAGAVGLVLWVARHGGQW